MICKYVLEETLVPLTRELNLIFDKMLHYGVYISHKRYYKTDFSFANSDL